MAGDNLLISSNPINQTTDISGMRLYFMFVSALRRIIKQILHAPHERKAGFV